MTTEQTPDEPLSIADFQASGYEALLGSDSESESAAGVYAWWLAFSVMFRSFWMETQAAPTPDAAPPPAPAEEGGA